MNIKPGDIIQRLKGLQQLEIMRIFRSKSLIEWVHKHYKKLNTILNEE